MVVSCSPSLLFVDVSFPPPPLLLCLSSLLSADSVQEGDPEEHRAPHGSGLAGASWGTETLLQVRVTRTKSVVPLPAPPLLLLCSQHSSFTLLNFRHMKHRKPHLFIYWCLYSIFGQPVYRFKGCFVLTVNEQIWSFIKSLWSLLLYLFTPSPARSSNTWRQSCAVLQSTAVTVWWSRVSWGGQGQRSLFVRMLSTLNGPTARSVMLDILITLLLLYNVRNNYRYPQTLLQKLFFNISASLIVLVKIKVKISSNPWKVYVAILTFTGNMLHIW